MDAYGLSIENWPVEIIKAIETVEFATYFAILRYKSIWYSFEDFKRAQSLFKKSLAFVDYFMYM